MKTSRGALWTVIKKAVKAGVQQKQVRSLKDMALSLKDGPESQRYGPEPVDSTAMPIDEVPLRPDHSREGT